MDVLSEILDHVRLRGSLYFATSFTRPWGVLVPRFQRVARFHMVVRGSCWVGVEDGPRVQLETGDLVLVPHGAEHVLTSDADSPVRTVDEVLEITGFTGEGALVYGGEDDTSAPTRLVCGHFEFDERFDHPLLRELPASIVIRWADRLDGAALEQLFSFIATEAGAGKPGHEAVTRRLSEVLFVQAIRFWADTAEPVGVLRALADPRLAPALRAIHGDPAGRWTLDILARKSALGRSAFASRFRETMGTTPHKYVTAWRMQGARRLLTESNLSLERIALQVGYDSAASFSRAFSKDMGTSPGAYRRARAGG